MTITRHKISYFSGRCIQNDNTFLLQNQNSDKTVGLNNSAAQVKVMPRSMQRLLVFRKVDTRWEFKVFWYQLLVHPKISLRLLQPVTKSFTDNAIALYSSCVCSSIAAMLRIFSLSFAWKVRGIIPPEFKTGGSIPLSPGSDAYAWPLHKTSDL